MYFLLILRNVQIHIGVRELNIVMKGVILLLEVLVVLIAMLIYVCWRIKSESSAWLKQGLASSNFDERNNCLRKAALLCNKDAILAYACNNPDMFAKPRMTPFDYSVGFRHFPCVFADHYFATGLCKLISKEQMAFMRRVYAFDGLQEDCADLIVKGIKKLGINTDDVVIVFMPCSNWIRFDNKFQHLCWKLQKKGFEANHMTYPVLSVRDHKDDSSTTKELMSHVGRITGIDNRKLIVVDDVYNTGRTLKAFTKEIRKYKAQIVGAVFVSKVFYPPKSYFLAWIKIVATKKFKAKTQISVKKQ